MYSNNNYSFSADMTSIICIALWVIIVFLKSIFSDSNHFVIYVHLGNIIVIIFSASYLYLCCILLFDLVQKSKKIKHGKINRFYTEGTKN